MKIHPKKSLICFVILFTLRVHAQYFAPKIDAIGLFSSDLKVMRPALEVGFARHFTAGLMYEKGTYDLGTTATYTVSGGASPYDPPPPGAEKEVYRLAGWGLSPEFRYYPFTSEKPAPAGLFVGSFLLYRQMKETYTGKDVLLSNNFNTVMANVSTNAELLNGGFMLGFKWNVGIFAMEVLGGVGGGMLRWETPNERDRISQNYQSVSPTTIRVEVNIGFVFPKIRREKSVLENVPSAPSADPALQEVAKVIIFRQKKLRGSGVEYRLYANDSLVTTMSNGSYHEYLCGPGIVKFHARTVALSSITLQLEKGRTYYLLCGVRSGLVYKDPGFDLLPPEEGELRSMKVRK